MGQLARLVTILELGVLGLAGLSAAAAAAGPSIQAQIQSNWPAAHLATQFLESVAIEKRSALYPFIAHIAHSQLATTPPEHLAAHEQMQLADNTLPTSPLSSWAGLPPGQLHGQLSSALAETGLLSEAERESLELSLAAREGAVAIEGFRQLWLQGERMGEVEGEVADAGCESFVVVAGAKACSVDEFWAKIGLDQKAGPAPLKLSQSSSAPPTTYSIDHLLPSATSTQLPLILFYGTPTHPSFAPLFLALHALAAPPSSAPARIQLALRWKPLSTADSKNASKLALSGYGAHLDIKKMDYITIDDRAKKAAAAREGRPEELNAARPTIYAVPPENLELLSAAFAQHIVDSPSPLETFAKATGSFPLLAPALSAITTLSEDLLNEVSYNQATRRATSGPSFTINGLAQPVTNELDPFSLLRVLRHERGVVSNLAGLHPAMTASTARELLIAGSKPAAAGGASDLDAILGDLFDTRDAAEGGGLTLWWNDLERDGRYRGWPSEVREVLRPSYPGQLAQLARNFNNVIFALNLAHPDQLKFVGEYVSQYVARGVPIRFGIVPAVAADERDEREDPATAVAAVMWHLVDAVGPVVTIKFLGELATSSPGGSAITLGQLGMAYDRFVRIYTASREVERPLAPNLDALLQSHFDQTRVSKAREWATRLGVAESGRAGQGAFFLNGAYYALDDEFQQNLQRTLSAHFQYIQQKVYLAEITDDIQAADYFAQLPVTRARRNAWIFPSEERPLRLVDLVGALGVEAWDALRWTVKGVTPDDVKFASMLVVTDLTKPSGIKLAQEALALVAEDDRARLALVHSPGGYDGLGIGVDELPEVMGDAGQHAFDLWTALDMKLVSALELAPGDNVVVINGRVVGPFEDHALTTADLGSLVDFELQQRILPLVEALEATGAFAELSPAELSSLYALAGSIVQSANAPDANAGMFAPGATERRRDYLSLQGETSAVKTGDADKALFEIGVVIDPATELAQRWAPMLLSLSKLESVHLSVYLNPSLELREMPVKRFYQFSFPLGLNFDDAGAEVSPGVKFEGLPEDVLFTLGLETHRSWLTFPSASVHDLDNLRLADLSDEDRAEGGVAAVFELENVLVEGHARETVGMKPPRGLQLELVPVDFEETGHRPDVRVQSDTIVMSNLGYFQLKANPGPWRLALRPGTPTKVYSIDSVGAAGWKSPSVDEAGDSLLVGTLEGLTLYPRVRRNPGQEKTDLLADTKGQPEEDKGGLFGKVKGAWGSILGDAGSKGVQAAGKPNAEVNVFTVASGLLYERMALLMMVSVMRHTQSTVKFWLITNFLSPAFKSFLPEVAREYGFDFELVTYQWPHWLRAQKEKQRTIWGYKILFLDVLFPLGLERVVFVDSDQIVRADLRELVELDLDGAPYGYAPMGDSRPEMEGFRFWKTGYWKSHLAEKPYHISALYVIDLLRFRQLAAGDLLRQQYQQLSADPNSLANLDQDLPNNMQSHIPIYTLPQDWLWCETWCDDESLATAKTIDLCNNPLTKEPKLDRARRQIPEWTVYDDEVAELAKRVAARQAREGDTHANAFALKADELGQAVQQKRERQEKIDEIEKEKGRTHEEL